MSEEKIMQKILSDIDRDVLPKVKSNIKIVQMFIEKLQDEMAKHNATRLHGSSIIHAGSAYESLTVKEKVDFDIVVVLGRPYSVENFTVHRDPSRFFALEWKSKLDKAMALQGGFLNAKKLQEILFRNLKTCIRRVSIPNADIKCRDGLASLDVIIELDEQIISIDLSPQIAGHSWGQCPDLKPLQELPSTLRRYIDTLNQNASPVMFFSPAAPGKHSNSRRLCNIGFTQLEKKFLVSNPNIRDMVRLVKYVADRLDWKKKYALKSFYVKRVAVKYCNDLQKMDLWNGYKAILEFLSEELLAGTIDGYFVKDLVTYRKKPEKIQEFRAEIAQVLKMSARGIENLYYNKTD